MDLWIWVVLAVVLVLVVLAVFAARQKSRKERAKEHFGSEYDRTVAERGSEHKAVSELREREERREKMDIRPLEPASAERYAESWQRAQAEFVDDPAGAIRRADTLVAEVMRERGYPVDDFEQRATDISVDHPEVVDNYRLAHAIAEANEEGKATTEDLRQAMVHYRALFQELLQTERGAAERHTR
jgi:predicted nucleic acid-binding protein